MPHAAPEGIAGDPVYDLLRFPVLRALFRWRRALACFAAMETDRDAFYHLLERFAPKAARFRRNMDKRVGLGCLTQGGAHF